MCGRYVSASTPDEIASYFDAEPPTEAAVGPSWNVAPTDDVLVVLSDGDARRVAAIGDSELQYTKGGRSITLSMPRG